MYLQNKGHTFDVEYAPGVTVGAMRRDFEVQSCDYNFNHVNVELQRSLFDAFEGEARRLLALGLIYPRMNSSSKRVTRLIFLTQGACFLIRSGKPTCSACGA